MRKIRVMMGAVRSAHRVARHHCGVCVGDDGARQHVGAVRDTDTNDAGSAETFPFTSSASGSTVAASVYVDSASAATGLLVWLYSDSAGAPGALLGQASLSTPSSGAWHTFALPSVSISASTRYWLAILGTGGSLKFRDDSTNGSCHSVTSDAADLASMPSSFSGPSWHTCNVSAYLSVSDATLSGAPIVSGALPSVSGDFSFHGSDGLGYGGPVSATAGVWTSSRPDAHSTPVSAVVDSSQMAHKSLARKA